MFAIRSGHLSIARRAPRPRLPNRWLRLERLEDRTVPSTVQWSGGPTGLGTNWLEPTNWVGGAEPGDKDDAVIGSGGASEITLAGNAKVHSVVVSPALRITAGSLTIGTGDSTFSTGLYLDGGSLDPLDGSSITLSRIYGPG